MSIKKNEHIRWKARPGFIGTGIVFSIVDELTILVDTGAGGGRGLEYIKIKDIIT
jgi:hypothetical protein